MFTVILLVLRKERLKEDLDLNFDDKEYEELLKRFMLLVDIDDNNIIELEEVQAFEGAQKILQIYFEELNVNYLTKSSIHELFPTKEKLNEIIFKLEKVFVYGERDPFLQGRKVQPVRRKYCLFYMVHYDIVF